MLLILLLNRYNVVKMALKFTEKNEQKNHHYRILEMFFFSFID